MVQNRNEDDKRTVIARPVPDPRETQPPTRISEPTRPARPAAREGSETRIVFGEKPELPSTGVPAPIGTPPPARDAAFTRANGPVAGWLVIVAGLGRGCAKEVYIGVNTIGREPQNRIVLDFGDTAISRGKAAGIAYDPIDRQFTVMPGEGANIVRHNGAAVYGPQPMAAGDTLTIGQTELRFVPFCGPDFQWEQG